MDRTTIKTLDASNSDVGLDTGDRDERDISQQSHTVSDPVAFDAFYQQHVGPIAQALEITLGNRDLAEDATNEAMARALQKWKRVAEYDNPSGWVYRVAMNWALSWLRRRRRESAQPPRRAASTEFTLADDELSDAVDRLSIDHRSVVVCRFFLDWSTTQTAAALDIAEGTVKSRLARALDNIRLDLEGQSS